MIYRTMIWPSRIPEPPSSWHLRSGIGSLRTGGDEVRQTHTAQTQKHVYTDIRIYGQKAMKNMYSYVYKNRAHYYTYMSIRAHVHRTDSHMHNKMDLLSTYQCFFPAYAEASNL